MELLGTNQVRALQASMQISLHQHILTLNGTNGARGGSSAWPMIGNTGKYVQVGWCDNINMISDDFGTQFATPNGPHYFYEINYDNSTDPYSDFQEYSTYGPAQNTTHHYEVTLTNSKWVGTVDGVTIASLDEYMTNGYYLQSGLSYTFSEEMTSSNSHYAGTSVDHARFSNMRIFYNGQTIYSPQNYSPLSDGPAGRTMHYSSSGDQSQSWMDLWDTTQ
jgi:hypothetical protein